MKHDIEDIISTATMFAICLTKGKPVKELCKYKTFFCTLSNTLSLIISEKSTKK